MTGGSDVVETVKFVDIMDNFFDCMNVMSFEAGKKQRKPFQQPYRSSSDFCLKVLQVIILIYVHYMKHYFDHTDSSGWKKTS